MYAYSFCQKWGQHIFACIFQTLWPNAIIFSTHKRQFMVNSLVQLLLNLTVFYTISGATYIEQHTYKCETHMQWANKV